MEKKKTLGKGSPAKDMEGIVVSFTSQSSGFALVTPSTSRKSTEINSKISTDPPGTAFPFNYSQKALEGKGVGNHFYFRKGADGSFSLIGPNNSAKDLSTLWMHPDGTLKVSYSTHPKVKIGDTVTAFIPDPRTVVLGKVPIYHRYIPFPPGEYFCAWLPGESHKAYLLSQKTPYTQLNQVTNNLSPIELVGLKFQYQEKEKSKGGIPLSRAYSTIFPIQKRSTIAYPLSELEPTMPFLACFKTETSDLGLSIIGTRAICSTESGFMMVAARQFTFYTDVPNKALFSYSASTNKIQNQYVGFIPILFHTHFIFGYSPRVGVYNTNWLWQAAIKKKDSFRNWENMVEVPLCFCLTLDRPQYPWKKEGPHPFEVLLTRACFWAQDAKDEREVASKITQSINESSWFLYNSSVSSLGWYYKENGDSVKQMTKDLEGTMVFNVNILNEVLEGMNGRLFQVDCTDLAYTVKILANAVGCKMKVLTIMQMNTKGLPMNLSTHKLITLGALEFCENNSFVYHQVAVLEGPEEGDFLVYDPCFKIISSTGVKKRILGMGIEEYLKNVFHSPETISYEICEAPISIC